MESAAQQDGGSAAAEPERAAPSPPAADTRAAMTLAALKAEAAALGKLASVLAPLGRAATYSDLSKAPKLVDKVAAQLAALPPAVSERGAAVVAQVRTDLETRRKQLRENLARDLSQGCRERGLDLRVVSKEEPVEVRIPPLGVSIDRERGRAEIRFAKLPLAACGADATEILVAREKALRALERDFDAAAFFDACRTAWGAARGAGLGGTGERVEILDFLPYLALQFQRPPFRMEPTEKNYVGYTRARFAYDVHRLRREGRLAQNGWRLNLGVATGTSAGNKKRVIWFEDGDGQGEFKLTVFFTRTEQGS